MALNTSSEIAKIARIGISAVQKQYIFRVDRIADQHQSRTDILGALDAARQRFSLLPSGINRKLVVSDFLEDGGTYSFVSAGSLVSAAHARQLAARLRAL